MADRIIHAPDFYREGEGAEAVHRTHGPAIGRPLRFPVKVRPKKDAVVAWVNDGRWVVVCPNCNEGQVAHKDDPRFLCFNCENLMVDGEWRRVIFPKDVEGIERELLRRSTFVNRVWLPHETTQNLKDEWDALEIAVASGDAVAVSYGPPGREG